MSETDPTPAQRIYDAWRAATDMWTRNNQPGSGVPAPSLVAMFDEALENRWGDGFEDGLEQQIEFW